ncbi:MAG: hypothetical protein AB2L12_04155 [Smithellaceae bacterium]
MLKIHCPVCKKSFLWTDDMPVQGKCPNADCEANYDVHSALKQNIGRHAVVEEKKLLLCPSCGEEISSGFTICRHCSYVVLGAKFFRKSYFFMWVCIFLILLSLILKYLVK